MNLGTRYAPEKNNEEIEEMLVRSGIVFFNLHRMKRDYYPTSLIILQADETDISYLLKNKITIRENA